MRFANEDGFCELNPFPACKWLGVSNYAYVYPNKRGCGKGTNNHKLRIKRAKEMGYCSVICTVASINIPEKKILSKESWKHIHTFQTHDNTTIEIWIKDLT